MTENHKLAIISSSNVTAGASRAVVERSEVAGVTIGKHFGQLIKRPISGLALIIAEQYEQDPQLRIQQDMALMHPSGSLVVDPTRDHNEALKAAMFQGIQQLRDRVNRFFVKNGHATNGEADPEIERVMREAIAEAAQWLQNPNRIVSKVQIERAKQSARAEFPALPKNIIADGGQSGGMLR